MKVLILLLFFSCSAQKPKETTAPAETDAQVVTESDAKQGSPFTVKPCYCMKIFKPVCAGGANYGNSCEAECYGHKSWTEGPCGKK